MSVVVELKQAPPAGRKAVLLFYAAWHESTATMGQVLEALAASTPDILFAKVPAEEAPVLSKQFGVVSVPTFVLLSLDGSVVQKIEGAHLTAPLTQAVQALAAGGGTSTTATAETTEAQLTARLDSLIRSAPVMLFMKVS